MRSQLLPLATRLVRAWTRIYTHGLPRPERTARRAEIDSDLWEFEHDPEAPKGRWAATQVVARLLIGIPDDLAWRLDVGATAHRVPVRALAAAGMMTGPRRISAFGLSVTIHLVGISAAIWLASRPPVAWQNTSEAAPGQASIEHRLAPNASSWNQLVRPDRNNDSVMRMPSVATPPKARALDMVSAVSVAVAARVGLTTAPRLAAQAPSTTASRRAAPTEQPSSSSDRFVAKIRQSRYSLSVRDGRFSRD